MRWLFLLFSLCAGACAQGGGGRSNLDAGTDSEIEDAAAEADANEDTDSGEPIDSGDGEDAGDDVDAGERDAGPPDAGPAGEHCSNPLALTLGMPVMGDTTGATPSA